MAALSRRKLAAYTTQRLVAGDSKKAVLRELAAYLIDTGRRSEAPLIIRDIEMMLTDAGTAIATVTTARPLSSQARTAVEAYIRQAKSGVSEVVLREQVDESLIGGMKLELPGSQLDESVKAKLDKITA